MKNKICVWTLKTKCTYYRVLCYAEVVIHIITSSIKESRLPLSSGAVVVVIVW